MSVRSVRYGNGVWRQMEEARVDLEQQVTKLAMELESKAQQLIAAHSERDAALKRVSELEDTISGHKQTYASLEESLRAETNRADCFYSELKACRCKCDRLEFECSKLREEVGELNESIGYQSKELNRSAVEIEEGEKEMMRLRDMLYDSQEQVELLEQQSDKQKRSLQVLEGSLAAKTRQISYLTKGKDELARKLSQMRNGIRAAPSDHDSKAARVVNSEDRSAEWPEMSKTQVLHANPADPAAPTTPFYDRALQRARALLAQEKQRSTELAARIHELELDRRELLARFRAAAAARRRAERPVAASVAGCA